MSHPAESPDTARAGSSDASLSSDQHVPRAVEHHDAAHFCVVAVDLKTKVERILSAPMTEKNAEAYVRMAVYRRGVEQEFFKVVKTCRASGIGACESQAQGGDFCAHACKFNTEAAS